MMSIIYAQSKYRLLINGHFIAVIFFQEMPFNPSQVIGEWCLAQEENELLDLNKHDTFNKLFFKIQK